MDGNEKEEDIRETNFTVSTNDQLNPTFMVITIPLKRCADDMDEGSFLIRGGMEEAKAMALTQLRNIRVKKSKMNGIIKPGLVS